MLARSVTLVLCDPDGRLLAQTPPFVVERPWWQEVGDVVRAARERWGLEVAVLRLLASERPRPPGGWVAYLAETERAGIQASANLEPVSDELRAAAQRSHGCRADWAMPGGHRDSLAWVQSVWLRGGDFEARQQRAWNLASLWRFEARGSGGEPSAWLKQVPPFLAHEQAVLSWLQATVAGVSPRILAGDGAGRMLIGHVAGDDCYGAPADQRERFARVQHRVQLASIPALEALARRGVPDRRGARLARHLRTQLAGRLAPFPRVERFVERLDDDLRRVEACALPDVLVHGDFHPGNVRRDGDTVTILDWGDSFLGNPAFDCLRLCEGLEPEAAGRVLQRWSALWRQCRRNCQPERAVDLLRPLAPLRAAATYAHFVAQIEDSEQPFHASDIGAQLELAERLLG